ncbi:AraC family ligand binding domain-containing protein [Butyricicoccus sp.]|uniref:AraC family transcriptional regulator n=1 Tax=Butyricicoccus sp. TaxID=2049021 RepID=UPI0037369BB9
MEESYVRTMERKRQNQELYLCFCGYSLCQPGHSFGPAVRPNYILHYVLKGKGKYQIGGRTYELEQGQGFLIEPNVMTFYEADEADPWTYLWIGFDGTRAKKLLEEMGLTGRMPTFHGDCGEQLLDVVKSMLHCEAEDLPDMLEMESLLYRFFAHLARDLSRQRDMVYPEQQNYYVRTAVEYIQEHYAEDIRVRDIAEHLEISRNYLSTLFQTILHTSPSEYLANFRLTRAKEQLTITALPIGTIASMCGYRDPLVFSKAFKLKTGMTPSQYRKTTREIQHMSIEQMRRKKQF